MTGEAEGKLPLSAEVYLVSPKGKSLRLEGAKVFIHVKGYSRARVTHLDIEHAALNKVLPPVGGRYLPVKGVDGGISITLKEAKLLKAEKMLVKRILVRDPLLNEVLGPGELTFTWVGGKFGGIYIGFRKEHIRRLEAIAEERFGVTPRGRSL